MNKKCKISASLMCADPINLKETINGLEKYGIDYLHIDIMDGKFVPNIGIGSDYIASLKKHTKIPFDYHIMATEPDSIIPLLDINENDLVSIHYESTYQVQRTLDNVKKTGAKTMIAINPATPLYVLEEIIYYIDGVNLLMVNPGFAGQRMVPNCLRKAQKMASFLREHQKEDLIFEVDGNITCENASLLREIGADMFVAGTSSVFKGNFFNVEETKKFINVLS